MAKKHKMTSVFM